MTACAITHPHVGPCMKPAPSRPTPGEEGEEFGVVHLHQSGRERWLHTSNRPSYSCDPDTYIETIHVRRVQ